MNNLKSLKELENMKFIVPQFQRGYRWQEEEVSILLEDLKDFFATLKNNDTDDSNYYLLQPIVVKENNNKYSIIDGQQRLTTLYILFNYLNKQLCKEIYYETRKENTKYINTLNEENEKDNIDFYCMSNAYKTIKKYFENHNEQKEIFSKYIEDKVKVIWYEVDKNEDEREVFERLNIGKIPLNNTELAKAMFLSKELTNKDKDELKTMSEKWYEMEMNLREENDKLYCVYNNVEENDLYEEDSKYLIKDTILRIEMYLKLLVDDKNHEDDFIKYLEKSVKENKLNDDWERLENYVDWLEDWGKYTKSKNLKEDLYHLIGYSILTKISNIREIVNKFQENEYKNDITVFLYNEIKEKIKSINKIDDLTYQDDKDSIRKILLLYDTILYSDEKGCKGFPYNDYKFDKYDIEHIHAQKLNSEYIHNLNNYIDETNKFIKEEIKDNREYTDELTELKNFINNNKDKDKKDLCKHIINEFHLLGILDKLDNLALLDEKRNKQMKNKTYKDKKKWLIENKISGLAFIPKNTHQIFYSYNNDEIWSYSIRKQYLQNIKNAIKTFLGDNNE